MASKWWKIRREMARLREQIVALAGTLSESRRTRQHDRLRPETVRVQAGEVTSRSKVAVLLIFQPGGVPPTVELTCRHLVSKGYAPLIVSNSPLSPADRLALLPWCWHLMERPNFGYDFGGYRDALWWLEPQRENVQRLLILNDSVWFPAFEGEQLLDRLEMSPNDVTGALAAEDRRSRQAAGKARPLFLSSFMLMVSLKVLRSENFWRFWRDYRCSDSKHRTIRQGERGFSAAMSQQGSFSIGAVHTRAQLDALITGADEPVAYEWLAGLVTLDPALESRRLVLLGQAVRDELWLRSAQALILEFTDGQNFLSTAPLLCLQSLGLAVVKKSRDAQNFAALHTILACADSGRLSLLADVRQEMQTLLGRTPTMQLPATLTAPAAHPPAASQPP